MGQVYSVAINRLVNRVNQDPMRVDKPTRTGDPVGKLTYALMSFSYAFQKHVLVPATHRVGHAYTRQEERSRAQGHGGFYSRARGTAAGLNALSQVAASAAMLVGATLIALVARDWLYNGDQWKKHQEAGDLGSWLVNRSMSASGLGGTLDNVAQAVTSLRYESDFSGLFNGAPIKWLGTNLTRLFKPMVSPSKGDTNTETRNQTRAGLNLLAVPLGIAMLTRLAQMVPGGPVAGLTAATLMDVTSERRLNQWTDMLAGPKGAKLPTVPDPYSLPKLDGGETELPGLPGEGNASGNAGAKAEAGGGGGAGGVIAGLVDDLAPLTGIVPAPIKAAILSAAAAYGVYDWNRRAAPFRGLPAPETRP
jgi:hypothetical protein